MPVEVRDKAKDAPAGREARQPQEGEVTSRGEPATEARADQKNALEATAPEGPKAGVDLGDVPLEDDPKRLAELQATAPQPDRGTPILRRDAYDHVVVDRI